MEPITLALTTISTLSAVVQAAKAALDNRRDYLAPEEAAQTVRQALVRDDGHPTITDDDGAAATRAGVIDKKLLKGLVKNIESAQEDLISTITDPDIPRAKKAAAADKARVVVCESLEFIKQYNGGKLPELPHLDSYEISVSHNC